MSKTRKGTPTVLVVDDDDDLRLLLTRLLQADGFGVVGAANALEAQQLALEHRPQLVLMDIGMPHEDGLSAIWKMREHAELADLPIVIVSAYDSYDLRQEAASTGCQGYLTKPLEPSELKALIRQVLGDRNSLPTKEPPK